MEFLLLELSAAFVVFFVVPGVTAAILTAFTVVVGRQLGWRIGARGNYRTVLVCAALGPMTLIFTGFLLPPVNVAAGAAAAWLMQLPGALIGASLAARGVWRFAPAAEPVDSAQR